MEYCLLGKTDCSVSRIGFGCAPASGYDYGRLDEGAWIDSVRAAIDRGINFFDVADIYGFGQVEHLLCRALGPRCHDVVIATKGGLVWNEEGRVTRDSSPRRIVQALEDSLRRLRLEQIPVYQVHWPDPSTPIDETLDALRRCQEQGKIGFIGVSNFSLKLLQQASELHRIECAQVPYNLLSREIEQDILPWCAANQVGILAHSGLARGLFSGKRPLGTVFQDRDTRARSPYFSEEGRAEKQRLLDAIGEICERTGRTRACVALRWVLDHSEITSVLVGIKDRAQLEENVGASEWHLSSSDFELLARHSSACPNGLAGQPAHAARS